MLHKDYNKMKSRWKMCRDAAAGEHEVHEAKTTYLPKLPQENDESYNTRLLMTPWFNASWRTIIGLRGMMFRREPKVVFPTSATDLMKNIDNQGSSFTSFLQKIGLEALIVGRVGVLCDYTDTTGAKTVADAKKMGARAYAVMYTAESIIDWKYKIENGVRILTLVRLREDPENHYDTKLEENQEINRILELVDGKYIQKLVISRTGGEPLDKDGETSTTDIVISGSEHIVMMNNKAMTYIPFQFMGVDNLDGEIEVPPLMDLITMNFHHYRQSSSYERGCFISGLPTLAVYGNSDDNKTLFLGGAMANNFASPQARMEFVEVASKFEALVQNLDNKERMMAVLGARMLEKQNKGVESADALARKQSGEESILADMASTLEQGSTIFLRWLFDWHAIDTSTVKVGLTREFLPFALDSATITALMGAYIQQGLSYNALYYNFEKAGLYPPGTEQDKEAGAITENAPEPVAPLIDPSLEGL